jgi:hypothetical protein
MILFPLLSGLLAVTALFLALPLVLFGLMLETARSRTLPHVQRTKDGAPVLERRHAIHSPVVLLRERAGVA